MAKGVSLHIGVDKVDPEGYPLKPTYAGWECAVVTKEKPPLYFDGDFSIGWVGPLKSAEKDAKDMFELAKNQKFDAMILKTDEATAENVKKQFKIAANQLTAGDTFLLTYAGHGSQVEDLSDDEWDGNDETWCLYDRMLLDDEQRVLYAEFAEGVNIVVLCDSCHSGSATRSGGSNSVYARRRRQHRRSRAMEERTAKAVYQGNKKKYDQIQRGLPDPLPEVKASRILFSACQDHEEAGDGEENGAFTGVLKEIWGGGKFEGNYEDFARKIRETLQSKYNKAVDEAGTRGGDASDVRLQAPNFVRIPGSSEEALAKFVKQRPFSI